LAFVRMDVRVRLDDAATLARLLETTRTSHPL
jgi:hypothetical protein